MYYLWMTYVLCLFLNVLGNMAFWIAASKDEAGAGDAPKDFGLSIIWLVIYSPCSMCWYIPAYRAFKTDSSFNFFIFFFVFFFQVRYRSEPFFIVLLTILDLLVIPDDNWYPGYGILWLGHFDSSYFKISRTWNYFYDCFSCIQVTKKKEVKNCVFF